MSETKVPFGYDDVRDFEKLPHGDYEFVIISGEGKVAKSGNPMVEWSLKVDDADLAYTHPDGLWSYERLWTPLTGRGAGLFKKLLKAVGEDADAFMAELQAIYDGPGDPEDVAKFFHEAVVPQLVNRRILVRVKEGTINPNTGKPNNSCSVLGPA